MTYTPPSPNLQCIKCFPTTDYIMGWVCICLKHQPPSKERYDLTTCQELFWIFCIYKMPFARGVYFPLLHTGLYEIPRKGIFLREIPLWFHNIKLTLFLFSGSALLIWCNGSPSILYRNWKTSLLHFRALSNTDFHNSSSGCSRFCMSERPEPCLCLAELLESS